MKATVNTIFPSCEDETNEPDPIVFHVPATYNNKVKIHDWQMVTLAEPRDNRDIFPPKGSLHKSTYHRLGPDAPCTGVTETQDMLAQIELKDQYKRIYPQRTLLNIKALAAAAVEVKKETSLLEILRDEEQARCMDYRTTNEIDYRLPRPLKPRPPPPPPPPEPWLLNRRTIGYTLEQLGSRDGIFTFLDDNLELHRKISDLKARRRTLRTLVLQDDSTSNGDEAAMVIEKDAPTGCP